MTIGTISDSATADGDYAAFGTQPGGYISPSSFGTSDVGGAVVIYINGFKSVYTVPGTYTIIV